MTLSLISPVIVGVIIGLHAMYAWAAKRALRFGTHPKVVTGQADPYLYAPVKPPSSLPRDGVWSNHISDVIAPHTMM
jgi:hypothetical protein